MNEIVDNGALAKLDGGMRRVTHDLWAERRRQEQKWGPQNHSYPEWLPILGEEKGEADKEWNEAVAAERNAIHSAAQGEKAQQHRKNLRTEMVQTLAVLHAMIECGDRNGWFK